MALPEMLDTLDLNTDVWFSSSWSLRTALARGGVMGVGDGEGEGVCVAFNPVEVACDFFTRTFLKR